MIDKVQKIREKVVWLMSNHDSALDYEAALEDVLNIIDSMQEEPVSIDFEQELYKAFGQVKNFTLGMRIAKWFYSMGKNSQEPVSEDLIEELTRIVNIRECVSQGVPVIKIAKHFAQWQKEQINEVLLSEVLPCFMHGGEADEVVAKLDKVLSQKK